MRTEIKGKLIVIITLLFLIVTILLVKWSTEQKKWFYYQINCGEIRSVYCVSLESRKNCLYAYYGVGLWKRELLGCGTFQIINKYK